MLGHVCSMDLSKTHYTNTDTEKVASKNHLTYLGTLLTPGMILTAIPASMFGNAFLAVTVTEVLWCMPGQCKTMIIIHNSLYTPGIRCLVQTSRPRVQHSLL